MNEIKFDVKRMKEVLMRLEEIREQLGRSCHNSSTCLRNFYENIRGEDILIVLNRYSGIITEEVAKMFVELDKLKLYLESQITKYITTESAAVDSLEDIKSLLANNTI